MKPFDEGIAYHPYLAIEGYRLFKHVPNVESEVTRQPVLPVKELLVAALSATKARLDLPSRVVCYSKYSADDRRELDNRSEVIT